MCARKVQTTVAHHFDDPSRFYGAVVPPIFQNSTFVYETVADRQEGRYHYARDARASNPTVEIVEAKMAALEGGEAARCFGSGMGAITAAVVSQLKAGDHVVAVATCYPVTKILLGQMLSRFGVTYTYVEGEDLAEIEAAIQPNTRLIYLESPSSAFFKLQDLPAVAAMARARGIKTLVDNSWATPVFQQPITMGIDLVVHSATKYLGGHSDVVAGVLVGSKADIQKVAEVEFVCMGAVLAPMEAWLLLRGLRTLGVRMRAHQESALQVAAFLEAHPKVDRVHYPGLPSHPQHELARRQMSGFSGLMSLELKNPDRFIDALKLFGLGVSWGGFESLVSTPAPGVVRLAIGLEDLPDLLADISQALEAV